MVLFPLVVGAIIGFLVPFVLSVVVTVAVVKKSKRDEEEYFRRMYWTIRQAQEDANKDKQKPD